MNGLILSAAVRKEKKPNAHAHSVSIEILHLENAPQTMPMFYIIKNKWV